MRIGRTTAYRWRAEDPEFAAVWHAIDEELTDDLEESALSRATFGIRHDIYHDGKRVGAERKFETVLTIFMLKARRRERYLIDQAAPLPGAKTVAEQFEEDAKT